MLKTFNNKSIASILAPIAIFLVSFSVVEASSLAAPTASYNLAAPTASYNLAAPDSSTNLAAPTASYNLAAPTASYNLAAPTASYNLAAPDTVQTAQKYTSTNPVSIDTRDNNATFGTAGGNRNTTYYGYSSPTMYEYSYGGGYYSGSRYASSYNYSSAPLVLPYKTSKVSSASNPQKISSNLQLPYSTGAVSSNSNPQAVNSNLQLPYSVGEVNSNSSPISVTGKLKLPYEVGDVDAVEYRDYDMDGKLVLSYKTDRASEGQLASANSIYLNQVPYTGPEDTAKIIGFISLVIVWSGMVAYYFVKRRQKRAVSNRIEAFKKMNLASVIA